MGEDFEEPITKAGRWSQPGPTTNQTVAARASGWHWEVSAVNREDDENLSREEQIAERAYELWQHRNGGHGNELTDWFQAEREIDEWHQRQLKSKVSRL